MRTLILSGLIALAVLSVSNPLFGEPIGEIESRAKQLRVLSLNTWMLEILGINLASDIEERRPLIVRELLNSDADIIALQEVWAKKHRDFFISELIEKYPYCTFDPFATGRLDITSDGLMIFSKHPIKNAVQRNNSHCVLTTNTLRFSGATRADEIPISKGAIHTVIQHPAAGEIDVYNSHLGALTFDIEINDYSQAHKKEALQQTQELMRFIERTRHADSQIYAMDLNRHFRLWDSTRGYTYKLGLEYALLLNELGLKDSYMDANDLNPRTYSGVYTFDTQAHPYAGDGSFANIPPEFIDYIFYDGSRLSPVSSRLEFTQRIDGFFLSDHYGLVSDFEIHTD